MWLRVYAWQVPLNSDAFKLALQFKSKLVNSLIIHDIWQPQVEEFLKRVNKTGEEATSQTASPQGKAEASPASSDSEDQEGVTAAQTATLNAENQKPPSSSMAFTEPGGSNLEEEAQDVAVSGSDGPGAGRQEHGCGRQLVSLDIPDYLRAETEDVSQGTSVSHRLEMNWQWT